MNLTDEQLGWQKRGKLFASEHISHLADAIDRDQVTPGHLLKTIACSGLLGAQLPEEWGGGESDAVGYGLLTEEIGKACSSVRSLMTVHNMSTQAILRCANLSQKKKWLPALCTGEKLIAFALSEPGVGSSAESIKASLKVKANGYVVNGEKTWITYGQIADQFLCFGRLDDRPTAFVIDRDTVGLTIEPIQDMFGTRGSMLASLKFKDAVISSDNIVGAVGMGVAFVASCALDHGRFSVAWGCTGIIQACLNACLSYAAEREQGGKKLREFDLIRKKLTNILVAHTASRSLSLRAAELRDQGHPNAIMETSMAKYYSSQVAQEVAQEAVHIHGANGCSSRYPVNRFLRDASVMGIIEGSHEILQQALANYAYQKPYILL